jgi:hypothetical protein
MKKPKKRTDVEPVPFEAGRYWVRSASRRGLKHLVDLNYDEIQTKPRKGKPACSCEAYMCHGQVCKHIAKVKAFTSVFGGEHRCG